jgi:integrase
MKALIARYAERMPTRHSITEFRGEQDWGFASPVKIGRLPYSYTGVWRDLHRPTVATGLGNFGTDTFRHTYRSWLDGVGTPLGVQQKAMRHSDIRTTMNIYGDVVDDRIEQALEKVSRLAFANSTRGSLTCCKNGSSGRTRTYNPPVNSRMLCH